MIDNRSQVKRLLDEGRLRVRPSPILTASPDPLPRDDATWDRVEGMLLGLAIGDSLGNTSEGTLPQDRRARYGEIRDYLPNRRVEGRPVGTPSDDTQLAFWTVEQMLADDGLNAEHLADRFCSQRIFGIGRTVREFVYRRSHEEVPWFEAGPESAGNGALMRIAPVLLPHLACPSPALYADALIAATLTHNDYASNACCVAFVNLLWKLLALRDVPSFDWWVATFCDVAVPLEGATSYAPRSPHFTYDGPISEFASHVVREAGEEGLPAVMACNRWYSAAFLMETVPSVLYILGRHGANAEEAIVRAVNDTFDNDTTGAIVGAAVGALHGASALPRRWIDGLSGKTSDCDDGRLQELIAQVKTKWWNSERSSGNLRGI
ncbi:MAG: ADP-ribosylglycohydrolase family protein [Bacteroidales bacterium]